MGDDLTDRDRLALAFDDLSQNGYVAPVDFAWTVCCNRCGMVAINELAQTGELQLPKGYVWWHSQKDEHAFFPEQTVPIPDAVVEMLDVLGLNFDVDEDDEAIGAWMAENRDFVEAAMMDERMMKYNMILDTLYLHWAGECSEIVDALRNRGLQIHVPASTDRCIGVFPSRV